MQGDLNKILRCECFDLKNNKTYDGAGASRCLLAERAFNPFSGDVTRK